MTPFQLPFNDQIDPVTLKQMGDSFFSKLDIEKNMHFYHFIVNKNIDFTVIK